MSSAGASCVFVITCSVSDFFNQQTELGESRVGPFLTTSLLFLALQVLIKRIDKTTNCLIGRWNFKAWGLLDSPVLHVCPFNGHLLRFRILRAWGSVRSHRKTFVMLECQRTGLEKEMATHPIFLPGESCKQRSLMGYSPWGHRRVGYELATKQQQY